MIVERVARSIRNQDWFTVVVEILVVVVGLVLAFQVDRWWEDRSSRMSEEAYVSRLIAEVEEDIPVLEYAISLAEVRLGFGELLAEVAANPSVAGTQPGMFLVAVLQAAYTYTPALNSNTFEDLRSTGNLNLIRSAKIKQALHEFYGYDQSQRQFISLNLMIEFRYFELSAGILTFEQYQIVQDRWFVVNLSNLQEVQDAQPDGTGVRLAAERLSKSDELLAWLPRVHHLQIDQIKAHTSRLEKARSLFRTLQAYQAELGD